MQFSVAWLREWVDPPIDAKTLADQLSMAGLEVDAITAVAPAFDGVVVGAVQAVAPHPNAEKLRLCTLDLGAGEPASIICGAPNVGAGQRVAVAQIGATLPGGLEIKRAKLRGVESFGMICSAAELGLAESSDGIWVLPGDAPIGADLRDYLGLDDVSIEVDLTPDRGDCLSLAGLAREVAAINRLPWRVPALDPVAPRGDDRIAVRLEAPEACPRYACRVVRGIDVAARTPLWMLERLRRSGLRAIHPVVDVTNYVMLELGQPMHGFDLDRIDGGIVVRRARSGERLGLLNGEEVELREDTLVIADEVRPVALAGIMGGSASGVVAETRDILFESAFFAPVDISGKARSYGLHTDSSHRFERGVDPGLQVRALERATELLVAIAGGAPGPVVDCVMADRLPPTSTLPLRRHRIRQVLGLELADDVVEDLLPRLGMAIERVADGWSVQPPTHRFDVALEVDLIADLGRLHGYDRIPIARTCSAAAVAAPAEAAFDLERAKLTLVERGYHEVITYSFVSPELQALIDPRETALTLANPISADLAVMRTSLWPALLQTARANLARQQPRVRIFESGLRFLQREEGLRQEPVIGGLILGLVDPEQWGQPGRPCDFFDLKGDLEALMRQTGIGGDLRFVADGHPALQPGQCARVERDGEPIGVLGRLHPRLAARLELPQQVYLFELRIEPLTAGHRPAFEAISKYPAIRRDLALVLDDAVSFQQVRDTVTAAAGEWLRDLILFDVYRGDKVAEGCRSIALGLILQSFYQTLTDRDVEEVITRVLTRLEEDLGARLRS